MFRTTSPFALTVLSIVRILAIDTVSAADASAPAFLTYSAKKADIVVSRSGDDFLRFSLAAWGPNWAWTGFQGESRIEKHQTVAQLTAKLGGTGVPITLDFRAERPSERRIVLSYDLSAQRDTELTLIAATISPGKTFNNREIIVYSDSGPTKARVPLGRRGLSDAATKIELIDGSKGTTFVTFDPPCPVSADGDLRIALASGRMAADRPSRLRITLDLPQPTHWYAGLAELPDEPGIELWYPWTATGQAEGSLLSMHDWMERPAGKHGRIVRRDDTLLYHNRPIKLWGLNLCYSACAPDKALAEKRASLYPKYGINAVRLHKFADGPGWAGIQSPDSCVRFDPAALDRMDYQVAKLKEAGVFIKLSAHFGTLKLGPADKQFVPFMDEFGPPKRRGDRIETPHSAIHFSPELQRVHILQITNLLKHRNPYTGLTYAEDPAIAFVEVINEQSILFYTSMNPLKASATLRKQVGERFCRWLKAKYGSHEGLAAAWGKDSLNCFANEVPVDGGEHLDRANILPLGNPWYWDPEQLKGSQAARKQRHLDTLRFLYELQNEFYARFVAEVRQAGYEGEILSSNWQAGRALSHFANLHSDSLVGTIDRHNYFGARRVNASMLARPGSGMLSTGMQQVSDLPFMLSEWIHVFPNEMGVEGPAIIGAYGMGLQGWDVSFLFQNGDDGQFSARLGRQAWDVAAPHILGVFPAVARQVLRQDVAQSDTPAAVNVHVPSLFEGKLMFDDKVAQGYDDKELESSAVPAEALTVARCQVRFTETLTPTPRFDLSPFRKAGGLTSTTGQLHWREATEARSGAFSINSRATKAAVGFIGGERYELGEVVIEASTPFAAIYVTARDPNGSIAESKELLVVALARARNTGAKVSPDGSLLLEAGSGPVLIEPVRARVTVKRPGAVRVIALDQEGRATDRVVPSSDGTFEIDGARDRSPYYLLQY